jgi:hypothetical protein
MENNRVNNNGNRQDSRVAAGLNLPGLPNWLPLSSVEPGRVESNLAALLSIAQSVYGKAYPEWLNRVDSDYAARLVRIHNANMWPAQGEALRESPRVDARVAA